MKILIKIDLLLIVKFKKRRTINIIMECPRCRSKLKNEWSYCPECGLARSGFVSLNFNDIFTRMRKEMTEMEKPIDRDFEVFDLSPFFRDQNKKSFVIKPHGSGFSIRIVRSGEHKPKVTVKTFGNVNKENVLKQIYSKFGIRPEKKQPENITQPKRDEYSEKITRASPKKTEEPKSTVKRLGSKVIVDIELPDVKRDDDIQVKELEDSVEVRALADDKLYFKILTKPSKSGITSQDFKNGVLHLEFN